MIITFIFTVILIIITIWNWNDIKINRVEKIWFFILIGFSFSISLLFSFQQSLAGFTEMLNSSIGDITKMVLRL